jgi:hypothetical protein
LVKIIYIDNDLSSLCEIDQSEVETNLSGSVNNLSLAPTIGQQQQQQNLNPSFQNDQQKQGARCLKISPNGNHLACGNRDGTIRVYDTTNTMNLCVIEAHDCEVLCLQYSPIESNRMLLASSSRDRLIHIFNASCAPYELLQTLDDHSSAIMAVRFCYSSIERQLCIISCGSDKSILLRSTTLPIDNTTTPQFVRTSYVAEKQTFYDLNIDKTRNCVNTVAQDRLVRSYSIKDGKKLRQFKGSLNEDGILLKMDIDKTGSMLATSCSDKSVYIWDLNTTECLAHICGHSEIVTDLKFSADSQTLITVGSDGCIFVWSIGNLFNFINNTTSAATATPTSSNNCFLNSIQRKSPNNLLINQRPQLDSLLQQNQANYSPLPSYLPQAPSSPHPPPPTPSTINGLAQFTATTITKQFEHTFYDDNGNDFLPTWARNKLLNNERKQQQQVLLNDRKNDSFSFENEGEEEQSNTQKRRAVWSTSNDFNPSPYAVMQDNDHSSNSINTNFSFSFGQQQQQNSSLLNTTTEDDNEDDKSIVKSIQEIESKDDNRIEKNITNLGLFDYTSIMPMSSNDQFQNSKHSKEETEEDNNNNKSTNCSLQINNEGSNHRRLSISSRHLQKTQRLLSNEEEETDANTLTTLTNNDQNETTSISVLPINSQLISLPPPLLPSPPPPPLTRPQTISCSNNLRQSSSSCLNFKSQQLPKQETYNSTIIVDNEQLKSTMKPQQILAAAHPPPPSLSTTKLTQSRRVWGSTTKLSTTTTTTTTETIQNHLYSQHTESSFKKTKPRPPLPHSLSIASTFGCGNTKQTIKPLPNSNLMKRSPSMGLINEITEQTKQTTSIKNSNLQLSPCKSKMTRQSTLPKQADNKSSLKKAVSMNSLDKNKEKLSKPSQPPLNHQQKQRHSTVPATQTTTISKKQSKVRTMSETKPKSTECQSSTSTSSIQSLYQQHFVNANRLAQLNSKQTPKNDKQTACQSKEASGITTNNNTASCSSNSNSSSSSSCISNFDEEGDPVEEEEEMISGGLQVVENEFDDQEREEEEENEYDDQEEEEEEEISLNSSTHSSSSSLFSNDNKPTTSLNNNDQNSLKKERKSSSSSSSSSKNKDDKSKVSKITKSKNCNVQN